MTDEAHVNASALMAELRDTIAVAQASGQVRIACASVPIQCTPDRLQRLADFDWQADRSAAQGHTRVSPADPVSTGGVSVFWRDSAGERRLALGVCSEFSTAGRHRFAAIRKRWAAERELLCAADLTVVQWFVGAAFADGAPADPWQSWPSAWLLLPRWLIDIAPAGSGRLTCCVRIDPQLPTSAILTQLADEAQWLSMQHVQDTRSDNRLQRNRNQLLDTSAVCSVTDADVYGREVSRTAADIAAGQFEKVVLARAVSGPALSPSACGNLAARLDQQNPHGYVVSVRRAGERFFGAPPETLAQVNAGWARVDCLAGTARRGEGQQEDTRLGQALLDNRKDRREHQIVVQWVKETLSPFLERVMAADVPVLRRLPAVMHLWTEVSGQLKAGVSVIDLVEQLHPTPAVAGVPREAAVAAIRLRETVDRGWYAGPVGWTDAAGDGEFAVALRSAVATPSGTWLFAGAGVMADSTAAGEWQETQWKLSPMLRIVSEE